MSSLTLSSDDNYVFHINSDDSTPSATFSVYDGGSSPGDIFVVDADGDFTFDGWFLVDGTYPILARNTSSSAPFCARFTRGSTTAIKVTKDGLTDFSGTDVALCSSSGVSGTTAQGDTYYDPATPYRLYVYWDDGTGGGPTWHYLTLASSL